MRELPTDVALRVKLRRAVRRLLAVRSERSSVFDTLMRSITALRMPLHLMAQRAPMNPAGVVSLAAENELMLLLLIDRMEADNAQA